MRLLVFAFTIVFVWTGPNSFCILEKIFNLPFIKSTKFYIHICTLQYFLSRSRQCHKTHCLILRIVYQFSMPLRSKWITQFPRSETTQDYLDTLFILKYIGLTKCYQLLILFLNRFVERILAQSITDIKRAVRFSFQLCAMPSLQVFLLLG